MQEIWKDIADYEGYYMVSNTGKVKSLRRPIYARENIIRSYTEEKELTQCLNTWGYPHVMLCKDGKCRTIPVHRLVASTFLENPEGLIQVNHKSEIKTDNRVSNLEWCTPKYNVNYGTATARRAAKRSRAVAQYTKDGALVRVYDSARQAHEMYGYSYKHISNCCLGKRPTHAGYRWEFQPGTATA